MLESDVWQTGQRMIDMYGDQAESHAALKIEQLLEKGDSAENGWWDGVPERRDRVGRYGCNINVMQGRQKWIMIVTLPLKVPSILR